MAMFLSFFELGSVFDFVELIMGMINDQVNLVIKIVECHYNDFGGMGSVIFQKQKMVASFSIKVSCYNKGKVPVELERSGLEFKNNLHSPIHLDPFGRPYLLQGQKAESAFQYNQCEQDERKFCKSKMKARPFVMDASGKIYHGKWTEVEVPVANGVM
ncbi:hypothetical protein [Levilactobacillus wangkuiensis]|uniref:hypothetical protein n=1 Tax=Levilactobacillus wangkuiensis TaxID=2799566 RepID=UPI0019407F3B|nr:hypothetical protein [Levilactobacillus wangkuiensis]